MKILKVIRGVVVGNKEEIVFMNRNQLARKQRYYRHIDKIVESNLKDPNYTKEAVIQELKSMRNFGTRFLTLMKNNYKRQAEQESYVERIEYWIKKLEMEIE